MTKQKKLKILFLSTYPPRSCGIANFCFDLTTAIKEQGRNLSVAQVAVSDKPKGYKYKREDRVVLEIRQHELEDYIKAARFVKKYGADIVCVQHEFGIFGGEGNAYLIEFLKRVKAKKVVIWHTVLPRSKPEVAHYAYAAKKIARYCDAFINITDRSKKLNIKNKTAAAAKNHVIEHGAPFFDPEKRSSLRKKLGFGRHFVVGTQGMASRTKGLDHAIRAAAIVARKRPDFRYYILGTNHPNSSRDYYDELQLLVRRLGVRKQVKFVDHYLSKKEVVNYLSALDAHITPYNNPDQISSGVLCYSVAAGNYNISTPFSYARAVLANGRGVLVPFGDHKAMARQILWAMNNPVAVQKARERTYRYGQDFMWPTVAQKYIDLFRQLCNKT